MLDPAGIGQIANLAGLIVITLAAASVFWTRTPKVAKFWLCVALIGFAVVICGITTVIASE